MSLNENAILFANETITTGTTNLRYLIPIKVTLALVNVTFNGYVIVLVLVVIKHKSYSNYLFASGALADLMIGLLSIPFMTVFTTVGYWPLGKTLCVFWIINDFSIGSISIYSLLLIAIHRYLQIIIPLKETETMTATKYAVIGFKWMFIYLFWGLSVILITARDFDDTSCYFTFRFSYVLSADLVGYFLPVVGVLAFNTMIFYELIHKKRIKMSVTKLSVSRTLTTLGTSMQTLNDIEKSVTRRESKALISLYVVAGVLIFFFAIFCVTWPLKSLCNECVSDLILEIGYWFSYVYSSINPIVLLFFHEKFKVEFLKMIKNMRINLRTWILVNKPKK